MGTAPTERLKLRTDFLQSRLFDIGWSGVSQCQACHKEDGTEKHKLYHCPEWHEIRREISGGLQKVGAKSEKFEERTDVAKRYRRASSQ